MIDLIEILKKGFCGEMSDAECANAFSCKECEMQYEEGLKEKVQKWLSSFDTDSATECFTAIGLLKERLKHEGTDQTGD